MREGRIALRNRRNRARQDPRIKKRGDQGGDGGALPFAIAEHLRHDQAQPLVEHVAQRAVHAASLVVRRVKKEADGQKAILGREKTLDRPRPPRSRFREPAASQRRRREDGGRACSQALETAQLGTFPGRRRQRFGLRHPISEHELTRTLDFFCDPDPGTR